MGVVYITPDIIIQKRIVDALRAKVAKDGYPKKIDKKAEKIHDKITELIRGAVLTSNEFNSLIGGKLRADFGLDDKKVSELPSILVDLFDVHYQDIEISDPDDIFAIQFNIGARKEGDIYLENALSRASYISDRSQELIDWLRWLMFAGGNIINESYKVRLADNMGRSGLAIMIKGTDFAFKVDGEFSGTEQSNFITRAIDTVKDQIITILRNSVNGPK